MQAILARNPAASALAARLWNFYGCRLMCSTPKDQETSRIRYGITEYAPELKAADLVPMVLLAQSDRMEEALVHELLHLELVRLGYPRFYLDRTDRVGLAQGITNCSDHVVMRPLFTALGYSLDRFSDWFTCALEQNPPVNERRIHDDCSRWNTGCGGRE